MESLKRYAQVKKASRQLYYYAMLSFGFMVLRAPTKIQSSQRSVFVAVSKGDVILRVVVTRTLNRATPAL